jgi:predicted N-acyltransferase
MRLDIDAKSSEKVFAENVKSRCRNKVRNADKKYDYRLEYGNDLIDIEAFYEIFSETMYRHGTPVLDKKIFYQLTEEFAEDIIFFNLYENTQVVASMCIILDEEIAWYPWGGVKSAYANKLAGYKIYWEVLRYICDNTDKKIFDFGRSAYDGSTYKFKSQFGTMPVKIDILTSQQSDIYAKYSFASQIWKKLPKKIVDFLGPKLCKYLVDL